MRRALQIAAPWLGTIASIGIIRRQRFLAWWTGGGGPLFARKDSE